MSFIEAIAKSVILPKELESKKVATAPYLKSKKKILTTNEELNINDSVISESNTPKPILQLTELPLTIDTDNYKNAKSNSNPNGDLRALFALRQLVNPVPKFERNYIASAYSTELLYGSILNGTSIVKNDLLTTSVIKGAKQAYQENVFQNMDGIPGEWRPIYSVPEDWASADISRFQETSIDFNNLSENSSFSIIQGQESLQWKLDNDKTVALSTNSKINSMKMKYLFVSFRRPWLDPLIFKMNNWYISGQSAGFCSSGSITVNKGLLPILPTGMLISKAVSIDAHWDKEDQKIVDMLNKSKKEVYLGPFLVSNNEKANSTVQIIGWVSDLIPFSPPENNI